MIVNVVSGERNYLLPPFLPSSEARSAKSTISRAIDCANEAGILTSVGAEAVVRAHALVGCAVLLDCPSGTRGSSVCVLRQAKLCNVETYGRHVRWAYKQSQAG